MAIETVRPSGDEWIGLWVRIDDDLFMVTASRSIEPHGSDIKEDRLTIGIDGFDGEVWAKKVIEWR